MAAVKWLLVTRRLLLKRKTLRSAHQRLAELREQRCDEHRASVRVVETPEAALQETEQARARLRARGHLSQKNFRLQSSECMQPLSICMLDDSSESNLTSTEGTMRGAKTIRPNVNGGGLRSGGEGL